MSQRSDHRPNVLIYADDADAGSKQKKAQQVIGALVSSRTAVVSTQVLSEYFVSATKKLGMSAEAARRRVEAFSRLDVVIVRPELILTAIDLHRLKPISFWDALIVRSAEAGGCTRLVTEDLSHGELIEGVRIQNPFR